MDNFDFLLRDEVYNEKKERPEADFLFHKGFYGLKESEKIKEELNSEVYKLLTQGYVNTPGGRKKEPRLTALLALEPDFVGEAYTYSSKKMMALEPVPVVSQIYSDLQKKYGYSFSYVLVNYYRDGTDSISFHSDDEPELGNVIGSLSFGCPRRFVIKHKSYKEKSRYLKAFDEKLGSGDLLIMKGNTQKEWVHGVPKQKKIKNPRWNLTFRQLKKYL